MYTLAELDLNRALISQNMGLVQPNTITSKGHSYIGASRSVDSRRSAHVNVYAGGGEVAVTNRRWSDEWSWATVDGRSS